MMYYVNNRLGVMINLDRCLFLRKGGMNEPYYIEYDENDGIIYFDTEQARDAEFEKILSQMADSRTGDWILGS